MPGRPARRLLGDHAGRGRPDPRGPFDLRRPRLSRQRPRARLAAGLAAAPATWRSPTRRRWTRSPGPPGWRGSSPRWRARTRSPGRWPTRTPSSTSICLSGRGDKDLAEALAGARGRADGPRGIEPIAEAFARARANGRARRADAVPDGRLPDLETSRAIGLAYADAGADLIELGVPFSDPLADGPVIHAAGDRGARRRGHAARGAGGRRGRSPSASRWWSCVTPTRSSPAGWSGSPTRSREPASAA